MQQNLFEDKNDFIKQYRRACRAKYGKSFDNCMNRERFFVLAELIAEKANELKGDMDTSGMKKVYYFSLEFLIGPLLENYLINLGCRDFVAECLEDMGTNLRTLCDEAESVTAEKYWPYPTYAALLFGVE